MAQRIIDPASLSRLSLFSADDTFNTRTKLLKSFLVTKEFESSN